MANKRTIIEVSRGLMSQPRIDERVALALADNATVVAAAAAAVDANPTIADLNTATSALIATGEANAAPTINALLAAAIPAGQSVRSVTLIGDFTISAPLTVYSDTVLDLRRATLTLTTSGNMIQSQAAYGTGRDRNITILGGHIDRGATGGVGNGQHSIVLRRVDRLYVSGQSYASTGGKYAILLQGCTDFAVENQYFDDVASDGVHMQGPLSKGLVRNIHGKTHDDMVAITPKDYVSYQWGDEGDVEDIVIEDVFPTGTDFAAIKILGGNGVVCRNIHLRNVHGSCGDIGVWVGDDAAHPDLVGGLVDNITISNINLRRVAGGIARIMVNGSNVGMIAMDNLRGFIAAAGHTAAISFPTGANVKTVAIRGVNGSGALFAASGNAQVGTIRAHDITILNSRVCNVTDTAAVGAIELSGVVFTATIAGPYVFSLGASASVGKLSVDGLSFNQSASNVPVFSISGTVGTMSLRRVSGSPSPSVAFVDLTFADAAARIDHLLIQDFDLSWPATASALVNARTATHTLPSLVIGPGRFSTPPSWLLDTGTTVKVTISGATTTSNLVNVRATGNITVRVAASDLNTAAGTLVVAAGGVARSRDTGFPADVGLLQKNNGDAAYNTNASRSCGVGPVICDGTSWKHLYTGATYA